MEEETKGVADSKQIKISELSPGLVEVRGKLKVIDTIKSPITNTKCIGFLYIEMSYGYSGRRGSKSQKWNFNDTKIKCKDFIIEDDSGEIKVKAKGLLIQTDVNKTEKKYSSSSMDVEYLLLENDIEYVLSGEVVINKSGEMVIKKSKGNDFLIEDGKFHDLYNSKLVRGCAKGIIIFIIGAIVLSVFYFS